MSGAHSRNKGSRGENELCALLSGEFGRPVKRVLGQARDSGTDIVSLFPFSIEVKRRKRVANLYQWIGQADVIGNAMPVVAIRGDGQDWLCVMRFRDWCRVAREEVAGV